MDKLTQITELSCANESSAVSYLQVLMKIWWHHILT